MKKPLFQPILTALFLLISSTILPAQDYEPPRGYVGLMAGTTYPTGTFAQKDFADDKSGYAVQGTQYHVEFGYKFVKHFGVAASIRAFDIPLDVKYLANKYSETYGGQFRVESERWGFAGLFVGAIFSFPVGKIVDFNLRFMPGLMMAKAPYMRVSRGAEVVEGETAYGSSIAMTIGGGAKFHLSPRFSLLIIADYLIARPGFTVEQADGTTGTAYQNVSTFSPSAGLAYRLFRREE